MGIRVGYMAAASLAKEAIPKSTFESVEKSSISMLTDLLMKSLMDQSPQVLKSITDAMNTGASIQITCNSSPSLIIDVKTVDPYMAPIDVQVLQAKARLQRRLELDVELHRIAIRGAFQVARYNLLEKRDAQTQSSRNVVDRYHSAVTDRWARIGSMGSVQGTTTPSGGAGGYTTGSSIPFRIR